MRIAFWGNFGAGNLGNECTLQAIVHQARSRLPGAELTCVCTQPLDVRERHGLGAVPISYRRVRATERASAPRASWLGRAFRGLGPELRDWRHAFATMRRTDMLVMCGTGMLSDAGEGFRGLPYSMLVWSLAARLCGRRLLYVSVGAESIRHPLTRRMIRTALWLAHYRCHRDQQSRAYLQRLGIPVRGDPIFPDLAFSLPAALVAEDVAASRRAGQVAVGLYDYRGRGAAGAEAAEAYRGYLGKIGGFVTWLLQAGRTVRIVIGDLQYDDPVRRDLRAWLAEHGALPEPSRYADEPAASVAELLEQLGAADLVVATRFHNVLLALMLGKPVVSLSYSAKNEALMSEMGMARYCQTLAELELPRLIDQFRELELDAASHTAAIRDKSRQYRHDLDELYARVFPSAAGGRPAP